jgi:hypothetical protein
MVTSDPMTLPVARRVLLAVPPPGDLERRPVVRRAIEKKFPKLDRWKRAYGARTRAHFLQPAVYMPASPVRFRSIKAIQPPKPQRPPSGPESCLGGDTVTAIAGMMLHCGKWTKGQVHRPPSPLSELREFDVTFNPEPPAGRAEVP